MKPDLSAPPQLLFALLRDDHADRPEARRLVRAFWRYRRAYRRHFALSLLDVARDRKETWELRRLAALMLQHQCACLPVAEAAEHANLLWRLGLKPSPHPVGHLDDMVFEDGYSTTELVPFLREFHRRMGRRKSLHDDLRKDRPPARAWRAFFLLGREDCAIEIARHVFTPGEVAERVVAALRVSDGEPAPPQTLLVPREADEALARWPRFERAIAKALAAGRAVYWVGEATSAQPNALVSQPPGTVVVVVKPPGSPREIEIKRAGRRSRLPIGVVFERNGRPVPRSHRLDGGSMVQSLRFEAATSALFSTIFRIVWGRPAPVPATISTRFVETVPVDDRAEPILDYFSAERVFTTDLTAMRTRLERSVEAFDREGESRLPELDGERGLVVRFLDHTAPGQSIQIGTSMYRLDRLARLLDDPEVDPPVGSAVGTRASLSRAEGRRLADGLLEETLGVYSPPRVPYRGHREYLDAALASRPNRARADRVFRSLLRQLGTFWGTLLGVRGYSRGESLVARNVGIAASWSRGRRCIGLVFMDHDDLHLPNTGDEHFRPDRILPGTQEDEAYAIGSPRHRLYPFSVVDFLRVIYRVSPRVADEGNAVLRRALARSYRRTRDALRTNATLSQLFSSAFLRESEAFDGMASLSFRRDQPEPPGGGRREELERAAQGYGLDALTTGNFIKWINRFAPYLERMAFLSADYKPLGESP